MHLLNSVGQDFRYAIRSFTKDKASIVLAILALSLGIGATTTVFSVVYSILLDPFPFKDSSRVVHFYVHAPNQTGPFGRNFYTAKEFEDYKTQNHVFSAVLSGGSMDVIYTLNGLSYQARGAILDPNTLAVLGVKPVLGRTVTDADGTAGSPPVFLISDRMWHERFNRSPEVLGKTLILNGAPRTLIAVLPPRFLLENADIFIPTTVRPDMTEAVLGGPSTMPLYVWVLARLKPGITLPQATADVSVLAEAEAKQLPALYPKGFKIVTATFADAYIGGSLRTMIYILLGAVALLLLIACSNVANLLLVRTISREGELAVRATLGASSGRIVRQLLVESFTLAGVGSVLGWLIAWLSLNWVKAAIPPNFIPAEVEIHLSAQTLIGAVAATFFVAMLCAVAPIFRVMRQDIYTKLQGAAKGTGIGPGHRIPRIVLASVQLALAMVLLVGAGLMMRSFIALQRTHIGVNPKNVLTARLVLPTKQYASIAAKNSFYREALKTISDIPGVISDSPSLGLPIEQSVRSGVVFPGKEAGSTKLTSALEFVSDGYFPTLGIALIRGVSLNPGDIDSAAHKAVVNEKFVHDFFAGADPVGAMVDFALFGQLSDLKQTTSFEIIGVVADARNNGRQKDVLPEAFVPYSAAGLPGGTILVKTRVPPESLVSEVRAAVAAVDPNVVLSTTEPLEAILHRDYLAGSEFAFVLLGAFAAIGLVLSAVGVFSVMAYTVLLETHDIGIRMALGASSSRILRMIMVKGSLPVTIGLIAGLTLSYVLSRVLASQVYGVAVTDPWTYIVVGGALAAVGFAACWLPARRATKLEPLLALRSE